jgi:DNA-binding NarL/FixJ family response regulator
MRWGVLIVDDHPGFRRRVRALLMKAGYHVVAEASDGESAVKAASGFDPAVVLLDVQLPDITGFEVARRLADQPDPPTVILVSSREAADYGSRIRRSGARGFIAKDELSAGTLAALLEGEGG